jgi:hypothetical protein
MYNDKPMVSSAALKKIILNQLLHKILEQMPTLHLTGKTNDEIISIITNAGKATEKCKAAIKNLGLRKHISEVRKESFTRTRFDK